MISNSSTSQRQSTAGFSLIELMVAISIMAILAGIIGGALFRMSTVAKVRATQTTIQKIDAVLKQRQKAVARTSVAQSSSTALANMTSDNIRAYKEEFRRWFPQLPGEAPQLDPEKYNLPGEILYATISKGATIGSDEVQGAEFNASELGDVDNDGLPEIIDSWGNPIQFYRWPTRLIRPDGGLTDTNAKGILTLIMTNIPTSDLLNRDPDNPLDLDMRFKTRGGGVMTLDQLEMAYHTMHHRDATSGVEDMKGTYHMLLVISPGPDGDTGLEPLVDTDGNGIFEDTELSDYRTRRGHLAKPRAEVFADPLNSVMNDNITNLNIEVK
ncbi:prepilin-type N-terminal cleavage/methylation domain-containing protein [Lacunimicrobium album]